MPPHQRREALQALLVAQVRKVAGLGASHEIDPAWPLRELGLDSLMSVELRNALGALFARTLSATLIFDHPTLYALADHLMTTLPGLLEPDTQDRDRRDTVAPSAATPPADAVLALSEEEAEAQLLAELGQGAAP
jgi:acyl carrier protein